MAGLARSSGKATALNVRDKKAFIDQFNKSKPSESFMESCSEAWRLFGESGQSTQAILSTEKNIAE